MTKVQLQVVRHMLLLKMHLRRKSEGTWCYHAQGGEVQGHSVRHSTVEALMKGGFLTPGFDATSLTPDGIRKAQNATI